MFDHITSLSLLYDFYGELLSDRQKEVIAYRYEDDLSLAEIASELGISRQGVHDALKNGEHALMDYEEKLGLVARFAAGQEAIKNIDDELNNILSDYADDEKLAKRLNNVRNIIDNIDL